MVTKKLLAMLSLLIMATAIAPAVEAAVVKITSRHDYATLQSRFATLSGTIVLAPGEVVTNVIIYANNIHGADGFAQGTYNAKTGTWSVALGEFDLYSYYVQIQTNYYGHRFAYTSQLFYWDH